MAGSVLKCPDDHKNRVVSAQATYPCGRSAVGGGVCEQRHAVVGARGLAQLDLSFGTCGCLPLGERVFHFMQEF